MLFRGRREVEFVFEFDFECMFNPAIIKFLNKRTHRESGPDHIPSDSLLHYNFARVLTEEINYEKNKWTHIDFSHNYLDFLKQKGRFYTMFYVFEKKIEHEGYPNVFTTVYLM